MSKARTRIPDTEVVRRLGASRDWALRDGALQRTFTFGNYHKTIAFVNAVAWIAHRMDHHPDLLIGYSRCVIRFTTHSAGGITELDFEAMVAVDALGTL